MEIIAQDTSYADIMQRLVRRYLFKMERENDNEVDLKNPKEGVSIRAEDMINASPEFVDDSKTVQFADEEPGFNRNSQNRRTIGKGRGPSFCDGRPPPMQYLALPQLDGITRTQKILDMRLQNLQAQSEQLNLASGNARIKEEIQHVRDIIGENQKALLSLIRAVQQIQETTHMLNNNMQQWVTQQSATLSLKTLVVRENSSGGEDTSQGPPSHKSSKRRDKKGKDTTKV